ncbi:MAG: hypothetical protein RBS13_01375 [Bacteroidales bacterium]|nr:hypothetical protein [Bacteroidales bacterium]
MIQALVKMKINEGKSEKQAWQEVLKDQGMSEEKIQEMTNHLKTKEEPSNLNTKEEARKHNIEFNPEFLRVGIELADVDVRLGIIKFKEIAKDFFDTIGKAAIPYIKGIYNAVIPFYPDLPFDSREYVDNFDLNEFYEEITQQNDIKVNENELYHEPKKSQSIPLMSAEYYMQIIKTHLRETKPNTYRQFTKEELNESTRYRAERFLEQMENSSHPMLDLEVFYEEMLTY